MATISELNSQFHIGYHSLGVVLLYSALENSSL